MAQKINEESKRFYSNSGSHYKQDVLYKYDEKEKTMVPYLGEKYDFYEKIQLAKTTVDLDMIIKRAKAGDTSVLNVRVANYADISEVPDNINDLHELENSISANFNKLDPKVRALFGDNIDSFSQAVANGSYIETINNYLKSFEKKEEKESEA